MKKTIRFYIAFISLTVLAFNGFGQGIRKHYTEFTNQERLAYRSALSALYNNGNGVIENFADLHADPNQDGNDCNDSRFNCGEASNIHQDEDFLPWHRCFILAFEWEIQAINPGLNIPYWDWTGNSDPANVDSRSTTSPLWADNQVSYLSWTGNFLGSYDDDFDLNRDLGAGGTLPSSWTYLLGSSFDDFEDFRVELENPVHGPPHGWVDGEMSDLLYSPRDPVFYFHHAMVDKIWQDWTELGRTSSFSDNDVPTFDGSVFPYVNPNNITDSREIGIFYSDAVNKTVTLSNYSVQNYSLPIEKFIYRYNIMVQDFEIPTGTSAEFGSSSEGSIAIISDFEVATGATFEINMD